MAEEEKKGPEGEVPEKKAPKKKAAPKGEKPEGAPEEKAEKPAKAEKAEAAEKPAEEAKPKAHKTVAKEDRKFVSAASGEEIAHPSEQGHAAHTQGADLDAAHAERKGDAKPFRIAAVILWVLGLVCEILAVVFLKKNKDTPWVITPLVIDFVLVVIGSQLWKKANHIDPPAKSQGFVYWLKTELGVVVAVIAFAPILVVLLLDKNANKQTKGIATIVAVAALVIAGASGVDYHPATQEALDEATEQAAKLSDGGLCYWTDGGSVYHFNPDCQALSHSAEIKQGDIQTAFDEGKTRGCKFCTEADGEDTLVSEDATSESAATDDAADEQSALTVIDGGATDDDAEADQAA